MAKAQTAYVCQECGGTTARWSGKCPSCGAWNSIVEEAAEPRALGGPARSGGAVVRLEGLRESATEAPRRSTAMPEFDRVVGGGLVPGSAILVGGDPGIGKSTLLLQIAARLAGSGRTVVYFSGEEAADQIRLRAARLGVSDAPVALAAESGLASILRTLDSA
ncbi:MAG: AAA family ATPase, partial [Hyphomicrobiales bacterium]